MNLTRLGLLIEEAPQKEPVINDQTFVVLAVIGLAVLAAVLFVALALWIPKFQRELRRINQRIELSTSERERQHYIRRRRRLWLSLIPFVRYNRKR